MLHKIVLLFQMEMQAKNDLIITSYRKFSLDSALWRG